MDRLLGRYCQEGNRGLIRRHSGHDPPPSDGPEETLPLVGLTRPLPRCYLSKGRVTIKKISYITAREACRGTSHSEFRFSMGLASAKVRGCDTQKT